VFASLRSRWGKGLRIERAYPTVIDVLDGGTDKGQAITLAAAHLGVPLARVVACGDSRADESLLRVAGTAVVVTVGEPADELRRLADVFVSPDHLGSFLRSLLDSAGASSVQLTTGPSK
jgi:hydroxymethylpyrimidine pyrophosphatase-like HAD family hydrolase